MSRPWSLVRFPLDCLKCMHSGRPNLYAEFYPEPREHHAVWVLACDRCGATIREASDDDMTAAYQACKRTQDEITQASLAMSKRQKAQEDFPNVRS